jgi:hypothetical protein
MPGVLLHTTPIVWTIEGLAHDPLADALAMLSPGEEGAPAGDPAIRFVLRPAPPDAADPRRSGWEPSFFHGIVQAYRRGADFLLWDRASRVLLPAPSTGAPIEIDLAPPDREPAPGSTASMLQIAIAVAARGAGLFHLHAAALVLPRGDVAVVVGGSGAGKTTTTLALLEAGADYLGDDALFLTTGGGGLRAVAFPRAFHLGPATLAAFPRLAPYAGPLPPRGDKRAVDPRSAFPGRSRPSVPLDPGRVLAIFPTVTGGPTTEVLPIPRADAFGHILASSAALVVEGLPGRDENLALLRALLGAARCAEVRLGADALADPGAAIGARITADPAPA